MITEIPTAFASYQVDAEVVDTFRSQYPDDVQLMAAAARASFTTARRAGEWLAASFKTVETPSTR